MQRLSQVTAVLILVLYSATSSYAQPGACLFNSSATMGVYFPNLGNLNFTHPSSPATVGPSVEFGPLAFPNGSQFPWRANIFNSGIDIQHLAAFNNLGSAAFNGFVFTFAGLGNSIASVSVDGTSTLVPFAATSTSNSVFVNYQGLGVIGPSMTRLNVTCVPEPDGGCLAIGIAMIGSLAWRARRR